jgi:hypothetical protein
MASWVIEIPEKPRKLLDIKVKPAKFGEKHDNENQG